MLFVKETCEQNENIKIFKSNQLKGKPQNISFIQISGTCYGRSLLEIIKLILIPNFINFIPLVSNSFSVRKKNIVLKVHINFIHKFHKFMPFIPQKIYDLKKAMLYSELQF